MNIPFNNLKESTQDLIAKEFGEEVGRNDWANIKAALIKYKVTLYFKVNIEDTIEANEAMHEIIEAKES